jgi:hypothetical protein
MAAAIFSLNRVRVTVNKAKLEQIADILGVPKAHRDRIIKEGVLITTSPPAAGSTARAARATTARPSTARSTASRTTRQRK